MLRCDACETVISSSRVFKCADCKIVVYCSKDCQRAAWKTHKKPCRAAVFKSRAKADKNMSAMQAFVGHVKSANVLIERETATCDELTKRFNAKNFEGVLAMKTDALAAVESIGAKSELSERCHLEIARVFCILGAANRSTGRFRESLEMYEEARISIDRIDGIMNPVKSPVYHMLALGMHNLHRYDEAFSINKKVVEMNENGLPVHRINSYEGLAACLAKQGNYAEAAKWYKKVLDMASEIACDDAFAWRMKYHFATCQLAMGENVVAYDIFKDSVLDTAQLAMRVSATLGMAHCMWNRIRSASGGDAAALHAFGVHLGDVADVMKNIAVGLVPNLSPDVVKRFLVLSLVYQRLVGAKTVAWLYSAQLLTILSADALNNCWGCGQIRNKDEIVQEYRLKSCGKCCVARFCNSGCQSRFSAGKENVDVGNVHFIKHRVVCSMLRVYHNLPTPRRNAANHHDLQYDWRFLPTLTPRLPDDAAAALPACAISTEWGDELTKLVYQFLEDMTADCTRV